MMNFGLNACVRCRSVIHQSLKQAVRCFSSDNGSCGGAVLDRELQNMHEHLKTFFPYRTPWRLNERAIEKLNGAKLGSRTNLFLKLNRDEDLKIKTATKNALKKEAYEQYLATRSSEKEMCETPMLWMQSKTIHLWENNELRHTYMFGPEIIIDCGFESEFANNSRLQRTYLDSFIKLNQYNNSTPHRTKIILCSLSEGSKLRALINSSSPLIRQPCFVSMHSESYLDLYDRKSLVYLTSDAKAIMKEFDPQITYIIGGLPDRAGELKKSSFAKARKEGVKMMKLPTQTYFRFKAGSSIVPLHRMLMLMSHARETSLAEGMQKYIPNNNIMDVNELRRVSTLDNKRRQKNIAEFVNRR